MRFRTNRQQSSGVQQQMTSMIDIVFLLLVFFMLTLKVTAVEGENKVNFPQQGKPQPEVPQEVLPELKVRLHANADGALESLQLGDRRLGAGADGVTELNRELHALVAKAPEDLRKKMTVTLVADSALNFEWVVKTMSACRTWKHPETGRDVPLIEKISIQVTK